MKPLVTSVKDMCSETSLKPGKPREYFSPPSETYGQCLALDVPETDSGRKERIQVASGGKSSKTHKVQTVVSDSLVGGGVVGSM